ncbi:hypothetical protein ES705_21724 [subsurface metagenome]
MIENYRFDKLVGPSGRIAGCILLLFGILTVYFTLSAIPIILTGLAMLLSFKGTRINTEKKAYQSYFALFGFLRIGVWLPFEKSDKIIVQTFKDKQAVFSWSNRQNDSKKQEFRILLLTTYNAKKKVLAKFENDQQAHILVKNIENLISSKKLK